MPNTKILQFGESFCEVNLSSLLGSGSGTSGTYHFTIDFLDIYLLSAESFIFCVATVGRFFGTFSTDRA